MRTLRNTAVDELILEKMKQEDEFVSEVPASIRQNLPEGIPRVIQLQLGEEVVNVLADADKPRSNVSLRLDGKDLDALAKWADMQTQIQQS